MFSKNSENKKMKFVSLIQSKTDILLFKPLTAKFVIFREITYRNSVYMLFKFRLGND